MNKTLVSQESFCYINIVKLITSKHLPLCLTVKNFSHPLCSYEEEDSVRLQSLLLIYTGIFKIIYE